MLVSQKLIALEQIKFEKGEFEFSKKDQLEAH